jgi:hypothetical protein
LLLLLQSVAVGAHIVLLCCCGNVDASPRPRFFRLPHPKTTLFPNIV